MKKLYLLRHSYAVNDTTASDFLRPLDKTGVSLCSRIANFIYQKDIAFDQIFCSPALRTKQTIELIEQHLNKQLNIQLLHELYQAEYMELYDIIRSIDDNFTNVMIVGHNPSITQIYNYLTEITQLSFAPGNLAALSFSQDSWQNLRSNTGTLKVFFKDE
jgi:phosphohistidine phosphatase